MLRQAYHCIFLVDQCPEFRTAIFHPEIKALFKLKDCVISGGCDIIEDHSVLFKPTYCCLFFLIHCNEYSRLSFTVLCHDVGQGKSQVRLH